MFARPPVQGDRAPNWSIGIIDRERQLSVQAIVPDNAINMEKGQRRKANSLKGCYPLPRHTLQDVVTRPWVQENWGTFKRFFWGAMCNPRANDIHHEHERL